MPNTVTCQCGQRITVGPKSDRRSVDCPSCGRAVSLEGASPPETLSFGVQFVDERRNRPSSGVDDGSRQIAFQCPGCAKEFRESHHAAGKRTRCPRCNSEFVIPSAVPPQTPPGPPAGDAGPVAAQPAGASVDAAIAAYSAAKQKRRWITPGTMVPIGFALITLGGLLSILGSFLMVKGYLAAFSLSGLGLRSAGQGGGDQAVRQVVGLRNLVDDLAREPGARPRRQPNVNPGQVPLGGGLGQDELDQQPEKQGSGQAMLIGGVIAGGVGMLMTFIGGIFLLAGLIGRFIQPAMQPAIPPPTPPSASPG